jgi:hypothetical protein
MEPEVQKYTRISEVHSTTPVFGTWIFFEMGEISPQLLHPKDAHSFFY